MKKTVCLTLSLLMLLSGSGCTTKEETKPEQSLEQYTPGTVTASAQGMDGAVVVNVTFSENEITDIQIMEENETAGICEWVYDTLPAQIIEHQSLAVDTVSGATVTSNAVLNAVAEAVDQAGGSASQLHQKEVEADAADGEYESDVVVVGAGLSGLMAALEAASSGAKVTLIEKTGVIGGTSITASGIFACAETKENILPMFTTWMEKNVNSTRNQVDEAMLQALCEASPEVVALMKDSGVDFEIKTSQTGSQTFFSTASEASLRNASAIAMASAEATGKGGENTIKVLTEACRKAGVEILLNTPATELIMENGEVTGVISKTEKSGNQTFHASAVVLTTGDYAKNAELTAKINPRAAGEYSATAVGNTGDGITLALSAGGVLDEFQESMSGVFNANPFDMPTIGQKANSYPFESIVLTMDGKRVFREDGGSHQQMVHYIRDDALDTAWCVMDQAIADRFVRLDEYLQATAEGSPVLRAYQATTIEDLAKLMEVDSAVLQETVSRYNTLCEQKNDEDCGKAVDYLSPIDEGPYYAVLLYDGTRGNYGGIVTSPMGEVVNAEGQAIAGLYAGGIVSSGAFFADYYPGGEALAVASHMGFIAGKNAAMYAQK
ncbi:FAD-dependent oxidoreductase [Holdemania massiliensis]|uniref:FAD-dependent oxidoreductase n=1 Tax=Holdemania massiliensis TaxID=1468449 RepID=UPI0026752CBF|nr:FAD-dependent oxidoreductase [Holdemania massiliensis]